MITQADVDKLRSIRAAEDVVLSVYLPVPLDPAELRELPARIDDLMAAASGTEGQDSQARAQDRDVVRGLIAARGREWLGHTVAIFVCGELGLLEALPLPCALPERAVLTTRPYVRPLLAALQRCPAYRVVVIDRRHAWVLSIAADRIHTLAKTTGKGVPSAGFGGWYGLESYRVQQRVIQLARHHYRDTAAILARAARMNGRQPLVIGGHADGIKHFLAELSREQRGDYAGCFAADPHTLTAARARELADPVIARWAQQREQRLASELTAASPDGLTAVGLTACLAAVNGGAAQSLLLADEDMVPGFCCERCGALTLTGAECPDWGAAARPVPDLLEEMALRTLDDGGEVITARQVPVQATARLRYPVPAQ